MASSPAPPRRAAPRLTALLPGVALAAAVGLAAWLAAAVEERIVGRPVVEALVLAIVLGTVVRTLWTPPARVAAGVRFAGKEVLEVAVLLLGASVDVPLLLRAGPALAVGIVLLVVLGLAASYALGRLLGLPQKLAVLVACGNSICGNSAIAAVAPVIGAEPGDVASAVAFTAVLGVAVVLGLPLLVRPLGLSFYQYGVLAGLTVYAVPQVLAATFPVSLVSGQVGTLVKLVRVLMLGPVVVFFSVRGRRGALGAVPNGTPGAGAPDAEVDDAAAVAARARGAAAGALTRYVPWFIAGFMVLAGLRAVGVFPAVAVGPTRLIAGWLTVGAMAALGLGVDLRAVARAGRPVVLTVTGSLLVLLVLAVGLIRALGIR